MPATIEEMLAILADPGTIATVGASTNPEKPAHSVPAYLVEQGFDVRPVNPSATDILGIRTVPSLDQVDGPVTVVQVFRPAEEAPDVARQAIDAGAEVLWLQLGIVSEEAARIAEEGGLTVVMNACMRAVHKKHVRNTP